MKSYLLSQQYGMAYKSVSLHVMIVRLPVHQEPDS